MPRKKAGMAVAQRAPAASSAVGVVRVSRDLLRRAKVYAAKHDLTATAVFNEALEQYLSGRGA